MCMDEQQLEYTVEYQDGYGVTYFDNVVACSIADAKGLIRSRHPDVNIRAVAMNPIIEALESTDESHFD